MTESETVHIQHLESFDQLCGPMARNKFVLTEGKTLEKTNAIVSEDNF